MLGALAVFFITLDTQGRMPCYIHASSITLVPFFLPIGSLLEGTRGSVLSIAAVAQLCRCGVCLWVSVGVCDNAAFFNF